MIFVLANHKLKSEAPTLYLNISSGIEDINVPSKADLNVLAFVQWSNKPTGIDEIRVFLNIPERLVAATQLSSNPCGIDVKLVLLKQ